MTEAAARKVWPFRNTKSKAIQDRHDNLDVQAPAFQPGAPRHPMTPGIGFSLEPRIRSKTTPQARSRVLLGAVDLGEYTEEPTRPVSEREYLQQPHTSARALSQREKRQAQLGCEDAWLLLHHNTRAQPEEQLSTVTGKLLFDLEQHFYPAAINIDASATAELTVRDEAMLEEAARMIALNNEDLASIVQQAEQIEAQRKRKNSRRTF